MNVYAVTDDKPGAAVQVSPRMQMREDMRRLKAFVLTDSQGSNVVDYIERDEYRRGQEPGWMIVGHNKDGESSYLMLHDDGTISGYDRQVKIYDPADRSIGVVAHQMYHARTEIFEHFKKELPSIHAKIEDDWENLDAP